MLWEPSGHPTIWCQIGATKPVPRGNSRWAHSRWAHRGWAPEGGRWWFRTTDLRLVRAREPTSLTWADGRKGHPTSGFDCSTLLIVSQRFAFVRGTNAGQSGTTGDTRPSPDRRPAVQSRAQRGYWKGRWSDVASYGKAPLLCSRAVQGLTRWAGSAPVRLPC